MRYVGVVVFGGLLLAACSGSQTSDTAPVLSSTTVPVATTVATTSTLAPATTIAATTTIAPTTTLAEKTDAEIEAEIIEAYLTGWDDVFRMALDPKADPSFLDASRQGIALELTLDFRDRLLERNDRVEFPDSSVAMHRATFSGFEGSIAIVRDCFTDDSYGIDLTTGEISNDAVATGLWFSRLEIVDGTWVVTENTRINRWEGVDSTCGSSS